MSNSTLPLYLIKQLAAKKLGVVIDQYGFLQWPTNNRMNEEQRQKLWNDTVEKLRG